MIKPSQTISKNVKQLVLGTAQLGMSYGIANKTGQPNQNTAEEIIQTAWNNGILEFDTAQGYGESEEVLGKAFANLNISKEVLVISKLDPDIDHLDKHAMSEALNSSLKRLGVPKLYGLMLHRENFLSLWEQGLAEHLCSFVESGKIERIGISVYSPHKAIQALNTENIDFIQLPLNILDQRFEQAGVFHLAQTKKKQIYARSIFLQGLILMSPEEVHEKMTYVRPILEQIEKLSKDIGLNRQEIALGYVKMGIPGVKIVFGAETSEQVKQNVNYWSKSYPVSLVNKVKSLFGNVSEDVINPVLWPNRTV